ERGPPADRPGRREARRGAGARPRRVQRPARRQGPPGGQTPLCAAPTRLTTGFLLVVFLGCPLGWRNKVPATETIWRPSGEAGYDSSSLDRSLCVNQGLFLRHHSSTGL